MMTRARRAPWALVSVTVALATAAACGSSPARTSSTGPAVAMTTTTTPAVAPSSPTTTTPPAAPAILGAGPPVPALPATARVRVALAGVWHTPTSARSIDQRALDFPVDIRGWLAGLNTAQREALTGRIDTQVLLGDRVIVVGVQGSWASVRVPDQPNPADSRGYPGWVPLVQLTFATPSASPTDATVVARTAWLFTADGTQQVMETSMGTRLPVTGAGSTLVHVIGPDGTALAFLAADVSVTGAGVAALPATADDVVRVANMFDGLPYLWAGASGFGVDCSGLTWLDYRVHGVVIPRDASAQATAGTAVARNAIRPGDVLFFATGGVVHHDGMYVSGGRMIHAPHTGTPVQMVPIDSKPFAAEYQGTRRYLG